MNDMPTLSGYLQRLHEDICKVLSRVPGYSYKKYVKYCLKGMGNIGFEVK